MLHSNERDVILNRRHKKRN